MVVANLGLLLAKSGRKVCVVDLDLGGADIHILFGLFEPKCRLTDFLTRKVESLGDIAQTLGSFGNLQLIAGGGDTLDTANISLHFQTLAEVFALAEEIQPGAKQLIQQALVSLNPLLITNMTGSNARINQLKLRNLTSKYLGIHIPNLGEIPFDNAVKDAMRDYLPVSEFSPKAPASLALASLSAKLEKIIDLFNRKRQG